MKRISPATVTLGVMAVVFGLVAAYVVRVSLEKPVVAVKPVVAPPVDKGLPVVTARFNLPLHHRISMDDLNVVYLPRTSPILKGAAPDRALVTGRITTKAIKAGQLVTEANLLGIGEGLPTLSERIPQGHRAVTIAVDHAPGAGKKIEEGAFVDIALTVEGSHPDLGGVATRTLLRRAMVVDPNAGPSGVKPRANEGRTDSGSFVTVAVSSADANKLITAEKAGKLSVTLCSKQDESLADTEDSITKEQLLGLREIAPPPAPPAPLPPKTFLVERWSGGQMTMIQMTNDRVRESREVSAGGGKKTRQIEDGSIESVFHSRDDLPQIVDENKKPR